MAFSTTAGGSGGPGRARGALVALVLAVGLSGASCVAVPPAEDRGRSRVPVVEPVDVAVSGTGRVIVVDRGSGSAGQGALFDVDPETGERTVVSDFGDPKQGATGLRAVGFAVEPSGSILVLESDIARGRSGALYRIDGSSGSRKLVTEFADPKKGTPGLSPSNVTAEPARIFVIDDVKNALFGVVPETGDRVVLSDFSAPRQGPMAVSPTSLALGLAGKIFVVDPFAGSGGRGALFRVEPDSGARTILSDFGDDRQGPTGTDPISLAVEGSGKIVVVDIGQNSLFRVDPVTGRRSLLSDLRDAAAGPALDDPIAVAAAPSGAIWIVDLTQNALFRIDPATGRRAMAIRFNEP